jgi:hypothetical protein
MMQHGSELGVLVSESVPRNQETLLTIRLSAFLNTLECLDIYFLAF